MGSGIGNFVMIVNYVIYVRYLVKIFGFRKLNLSEVRRIINYFVVIYVVVVRFNGK